MTELPHRHVRDPHELRAMAHPVRLRILEELTFGGPATATELAERVGESPANCSWHLRQLARYGYVEEAGGGTGRRRPWRAVLATREWGSGDQTPELAHASDAVSDVVFGREYEALRAWWARRRSEPAAWRDGAYAVQSMGWLTVDELTELSDEIRRLLLRYVDRVGEPERRPPGSRPIRFAAWAVPARPL
ncbi:MAG TPA: helix-turn-helix domain-containing protein [Micromonosporaceae bacterium]|nr:helix-turn-helix domain-containing protein [Micromonosporaceae bacterium]